MTQTVFVRSGAGVWKGKATRALALLCALFNYSCTEKLASDPPSQDIERVIESDEQSPNARILPEPLHEGVPPKSKDATGRAESESLPVPRKPKRPWPLRRALVEDLLRQKNPTGYRGRLSFSWPSLQQKAKVMTGEINTWPIFEVQLLRETPKRAGRLRLITRGRAFPLPEGSELRARSDRLGYALMWPDGRSYRIVPTGALRSLLLDRRVDRVPFVEATVAVSPEKEGEKQSVRRLELETSIGRARLESTYLRNLPYASTLLCQALLEFIRVEGNDELCPSGYLPLKFEVTWTKGESLLVELSELKPVSDLVTEKFRVPPGLPILKNGELPPFKGYFLSESERGELLPLSKTKEPPLPVPAEPPGADPTLAKPTPQPPLAQPQARNEILLENKFDRPLLVAMNRLPFVWLSPGESLPFYLKPGEVRLSARDFLGEERVQEQIYKAPSRVHFGEKISPSAPAK